MADSEDAGVDAMQPPRLDSLSHSARRKADLDQLDERDHAVLTARERSDRTIERGLVGFGG